MATRADLASLREGQSLSAVPLTTAEAGALNASGMVTVKPGTDGWQITAQYVVGTMRRGDLLVRVAPKVGAVKVLTLMARAHGVSYLTLDTERVAVSDDADLSAVLARLFCQEARGALAAGPLRGYRTEDQTLPVLRGRVRLRDQYLRRFNQLHPLEVTVDEWTADTDENRLIRSAAVALLQQPGLGDDLELELRHIDRLLAEATPLTPGTTASWTPTRLNVRLHGLLALSELALRCSSVESDAGDTVVHGFRLNLATVFEVLVARLFAEAAPRWSAQSTYPLDTGGVLTIRPDLVHERAGGVTAVIDTKYKVLDDAGKVSNADIYQLVTYCERLGLSAGHLIYADGGAPPAPYEVRGTGVSIAVHRIDLSLPLPELETQIHSLASALADEHRHPTTDDSEDPHGLVRRRTG